MKVLGICGSPRRGGNSETLLDKVLEGCIASGAETEKIKLIDLQILPCSEEEYAKINPDGSSVMKDDWNMACEKIKEADAVVLASPIFFGSITAQLKAFIDRFQCVWTANTFHNMDLFKEKRLGGFICVQAQHEKKYFENADFIIRNLFAVLNIEYAEKLYAEGLDKKNSVFSHEEYLNEAFLMGKKIVKHKGV